MNYLDITKVGNERGKGKRRVLASIKNGQANHLLQNKESLFKNFGVEVVGSEITNLCNLCDACASCANYRSSL